MAAGVSILLLAFFSATRMFHTFDFGMLDFLFILLPVGILFFKYLLELLFLPDPESDNAVAPTRYVGAFFRPMTVILRDWFPFFLLTACYYSLYDNLLLRVNPHTADASLAAIDSALFGTQPSFLLEPYIRPWITEFLNVVYFSHVIVFPTIALYFYLRKERWMFRRMMMGYLTIFLMAVVSYLLVPAVGPEKFFASQYAHDLRGEILSRGVSYIIDIGRVSHDCFPSMHVGIPLLLTLYLRDHCRKAFVPALVYVAFMCAATIYLRYHYAIDVIAAFVYVPAAYFLNDLILRHWPGEKISGMAQHLNDQRVRTVDRPSAFNLKL